MSSEVIKMYILIFTRISKFRLLFMVLSHSLAIAKKLLTATMFILTFSIFNFLPVDLEPSQWNLSIVPTKRKNRLWLKNQMGTFLGEMCTTMIKWYYRRNKGFGISSLAQAFISCLTLSSYQIFLSICLLLCKMYISILSDRTIMRSK